MNSENFKFIKPGEIRTRIAPAPTGFLHIGTARTALFNYLFAKKYQGSFILRIEDTDKERSKIEFENDILDSLKWLGIEWDEFYRQSERIETYEKYLKKLLNENKAYYCFCSKEELEAQRQYCLSQGQSWHYNGKCALFSKEEVEKKIKSGVPYIIRFKTPIKKLEFQDLIRGKIEFDTSLIGDFSIARQNQFLGENKHLPLYNFACVIDDFEMRISHIIRGEDHISNTPKQILLQEALDFPRPQYIHLPLILGPDRTKLSKRHGAISITDFRKQGYLPESLINFMAFLGWNPGTERELYSLPSLIKEFSLEGIQKGGAIFNIKRLDFLNGFYIRQKSLDKLTELCIPYLIENNLITPILIHGEIDKAYAAFPEISHVENYEIIATHEIINFDFLKKIVSIYQERLKILSEITELTDFFFKDKLEYNKDFLKWQNMSDKDTKKSLEKLEKVLSKININDWKKENLENILISEAEKFSKEINKTENRGYLLWPLRVALTGKKASAGPFEIAEILGKEKSLKRIKIAKELF